MTFLSETKRKCFISFKTSDIDYKKAIQDELDVDMIDKSLNETIDSEDEDYVMRKIREEHLSDSTVTIFLIGEHSSENDVSENQTYIKRELQASLYNNPPSNTRNGILGVVLPKMMDKIYKGEHECGECGNKHNCIAINKDTVVEEFRYNYYLPNPAGGCSWSENDRYCVLISWKEFCNNPNKYINQAFNKRTSDIADKVKVYPK